MRYNGYMKYNKTPPSDSRFDDEGCPIRSSPCWSEPIECFISIADIDIIDGKEGGCYTRQSYELITERMNIDTDRVMLSLNGRVLGEFEVVYIQHTCLDRVKMVVE